MSETYEEWRVTGTDPSAGPVSGVLFTPGHDGDAEAHARDFADWARTQDWADGPHLHKRTVTVNDWEAA